MLWRYKTSYWDHSLCSGGTRGRIGTTPCALEVQEVVLGPPFVLWRYKRSYWDHSFCSGSTRGRTGTTPCVLEVQEVELKV